MCESSSLYLAHNCAIDIKIQIPRANLHLFFSYCRRSFETGMRIISMKFLQIQCNFFAIHNFAISFYEMMRGLAPRYLFEFPLGIGLHFAKLATLQVALCITCKDSPGNLLSLFRRLFRVFPIPRATELSPDSSAKNFEDRQEPYQETRTRMPKTAFTLLPFLLSSRSPSRALFSLLLFLLLFFRLAIFFPSLLCSYPRLSGNDSSFVTNRCGS